MTERTDLAASVGPLARILIAMETPILAEHGLSMWAYIVLSRLAQAPVRGQSLLASSIGADKTRVIEVLDDLQDRNLIRRTPDPDDRRTRMLDVTPTGRRLHERTQRAIHRAEDELLAGVPKNDRAAFQRVLRQLVEDHP